MKHVIVVAGLAILAASPALADKASYCTAYARDFADQRATDKVVWQHKYEIALDACLAKSKAVVAKVQKPLTFPPKTKNLKVAAPVPKPIEAAPAPVAKKPVVQPAALAKPLPGTVEWNEYCAKKYTSFNVKKGTYMSNTGVERKCLVTN